MTSPETPSSSKEITKRERSEQALQEAEQHFRAVAESVNDAVVSAGPDNRIVFWNEAAEAIFGHSAEEALGMPLTALMPERFRERHLHAFTHLVEGGQPRLLGQTLELEGLRRDGSEFPLELSLGSWRQGERTFFTGVVRDIGERRRAARYLAAQHAVQEILLESPDMEVAMPRLLAAVGQAMGWECGGFWLPDPDLDELRCEAFWAAQANPEFEAATRELRLRRGEGLPGGVWQAGEPRWVLDVRADAGFRRAKAAIPAALRGAVALPVLSGGGQVVGVLEFLSSQLARPDHDMTRMMSTISTQVGQFVRRKHVEQALAATAAELRRRAAELERSNAELQQFAYMASHDLSEPLRMISGFAQLLERRYGGSLDQDAGELIAYILDGTERMRTLIDDLLAYSRVGRTGQPDEDVDLAESLHMAREAVAAAIAETGAEVRATGPLPVVRGNRRELAQLLQNLLSNAIKFVAEGPPRVEVSASRVDGMWDLAVRDNGIGIEPRHAERIFEMFQRLHPRDDYEGTGIGLAICKKIAERHGGDIRVEAAPGGGSVFHVTLPGPGESV
jgi:PAS domain S-box-containing protein